MPTLIPETGTGFPDANTYVSLAWADDYFAQHPFYADAWDELDPSTKEMLLISATRTLDVQFYWKGYRSTTTQALEWPRRNVRDMYDTLIQPNVIPRQLMEATAEQAYFLTKGDKSVEAQVSSGLDRLKVDVIELEYSSSSSSSSSTQPVPSTVRQLLRGLGDYISGIRVRRVEVR